MLSVQVLTVLSVLYSFVCANVIPRETTRLSPNFNAHDWHINATMLSNATLATKTIVIPSHIPIGKPQKCCFLVQDTASEVWWERTSYKTQTTVVTTMSYFQTAFPNTTVINSNSTVHTSTVIISRLVGRNPLTLTGDVTPVEAVQSLTGSTPITTGGIVVPSPAAFFVYNTVRIITADAVVDKYGNYKCATSMEPYFSSINSNAQKYFGAIPVDSPFSFNRDQNTITASTAHKRDILTTTSSVLPVATPVNSIATVTSASPSLAVPAPSPTILTLTEPFIYLPTWAAKGRSSFDGVCHVGGRGTEDYGYIPRTLLDHLAGNQYYLNQYPGLGDCVPGGPGFVYKMAGCPLSFGGGSTEAAAVAGDLTSTVIFRVNQQGQSTPIKTSSPKDKGQNAQPINNGEKEKENPSDGKSDTFNIVIPSDANSETTKNNGNSNTNESSQKDSSNKNGQSQSQQDSGSNSNSNNPGEKKGEESNNNGQLQTEQKNKDESIGSIINSIMGGPTENSRKADQSSSGSGSGSESGSQDPKPLVFTAGQVVPVSNAPIGLTGDIKTINGESVYVVPAAVTVPAPPASLINNAGNTRVIDGTPFIIVPSATNIPLNFAPPGIKGITTVVDGKSYLAIPGPITYAVKENLPKDIGSTKVIDGTPFMVIPAATNIPIADVPAGLQGKTTVVDGKSYLAVTGPVTYAANAVNGNQQPKDIGSTKVIDGTAFMVIPSATNIPLALAPVGLKGSTTVIDGKSYLAVPSPITYAANPNPQITSGPSQGTTLLIGNVPFVVYPPGKEIPLSEALAAGISTGGVTRTAADGSTYVSFSAATTVAAVNTKEGQNYGSTILVDNTPYLVLPTNKPIPASLFPSGLGAGAKTTRINGEDFLVLSSSTQVPFPTKTSATDAKITGGQLTVIIDGSSRLIIAGATTMPLNSNFDISGSKTVISGTTMVVVTGPTTVAGKTSASESSRTPTTVKPAPTGADQAPNSGGNRHFAVGGLFSIAFVIFSVLLL